MVDRAFQRRHYDALVRERRPTRLGLGCGFDDRYDPALLDRRPLLRRAWVRLLDRLLPEPARSLLDLGCGTAYYWPLLAARCGRLAGVDLSPAMAAEGLRRRGPAPRAAALAAETGALPFEAGSFDAVLAVDVFHHLADLGRALDEAARVLAPGGRLLLVEPNVLNPVVLLAHLVPPEERGALWPNHPLALRRGLGRRFVVLRDEPVTYVSGLEWEPALRLVEAAEPLLAVPPLSVLALRRAIVARKA